MNLFERTQKWLERLIGGPETEAESLLQSVPRLGFISNYAMTAVHEDKGKEIELKLKAARSVLDEIGLN